MTVTVFIVDDHELFRDGVRGRLSADPRVEVIGEADEVAAAVELIRERRPDVVLLDVNLPGGGGQLVVQDVVTTHPDVRFLALSASEAAEDVVAVMSAGATGYVTKSIEAAELGRCDRAGRRWYGRIHTISCRIRARGLF